MEDQDDSTPESERPGINARSRAKKEGVREMMISTPATAPAITPTLASTYISPSVINTAAPPDPEIHTALLELGFHYRCAHIPGGYRHMYSIRTSAKPPTSLGE